MPLRPPPLSPGLSFDMIDAAGYGYVRVWNERSYLLRLAFFPVLIKFIGVIIAYALDYQDDLLRRGLLVLPATFAEGWVLAQFLRTLLMEERWPQTLPKEPDDETVARLLLRARAIISSTLIFVLIQMIATIIGWVILQMDSAVNDMVAAQKSGAAPPPSEQFEFFPHLMFLPIVAFLVGSFWAFRLIWLNIPYAVLMPGRIYLARLGGMMASVRMIGLFLVCVIPCSVLASVISQSIFSQSGAETAATAPPIAQFVVMAITAVTDMVTALISTAAMAYAMRNILPHTPDALQDVHVNRKDRS